MNYINPGGREPPISGSFYIIFFPFYYPSFQCFFYNFGQMSFMEKAHREIFRLLPILLLLYLQTLLKASKRFIIIKISVSAVCCCMHAYPVVKKIKAGENIIKNVMKGASSIKEKKKRVPK